MQDNQTVPTSVSKGSVFANLAALKVGLDLGTAGSSEVMATVPVRKGKKQEYFRVNPDRGCNC